jgi:hypothetical protein
MTYLGSDACQRHFPFGLLKTFNGPASSSTRASYRRIWRKHAVDLEKIVGCFTACIFDVAVEEEMGYDRKYGINVGS